MTDKKRPRDARIKASLDLGFGNLFKGLGDFIDLVSEMVETAEGTETTRTGEFQLKGLGDKARGVYGFSVRSGIGGVPRVERFGNIRATEEGPTVADVREPLVDSFDEGDEVVLVAELPGVAEDEISVEIAEDILALQTSGERKYAREILLPQAVDAATLTKTYRNGILELRLKKV